MSPTPAPPDPDTDTDYILSQLEIMASVNSHQLRVAERAKALSLVSPVKRDLTPPPVSAVPAVRSASGSTTPTKGAENVGDRNKQKVKKQKFPSGKFFVELVGFADCGSYIFVSLIDDEAWRLFGFNQNWIKSEIERGAVEKLNVEYLVDEQYVVLKSGDDYRRVMWGGYKVEDGQKLLVFMDRDQLKELKFSPNHLPELYDMPEDALRVPFRAVKVKIDKMKLFEDTGLLYKLFMESKLKTETVFLAETTDTSGYLKLFTPDKRNVGEILLNQLKQMEVPVVGEGGLPIIITITHCDDEKQQIFYQAIEEQASLLTIVESFDLLIKKEMPTIRTLYPDNSSETVLKKMIKEKNCVFAAPYQDVYYRAVVEGDLLEENQVNVRFIDYGNTQVMPLSSLVVLNKLDPAISIIPPLARPIYVEGLYAVDPVKINRMLETYENGEATYSMTGYYGTWKKGEKAWIGKIIVGKNKTGFVEILSNF